MLRPLIPLALALAASAQTPALLAQTPASAQTPAPQKPFTPNAQLNLPARVGYDAFVIGTKEKLEIGGHRELTITSAELALTFPNRAENVIATAAEKLLIIRGSLRNAEKTSNINLGPSAVVGLRLAQRYTGTGKFAFVLHYDPVTLNHVRHNLKGGQSASFVGVWRIPADFTDFRLGFTSDTPKYVAWYDFTSTLTRLKSIHAAPGGLTTLPSAQVPANTTFSLDGLTIQPGPLTRPARIAGAATDLSKPFYVVNLNVTNSLLLPVRWGWQYINAELIAADGSATKFYPNIINQSNDTPWSGDLDPGATATSQLLFYPATPITPRALRLTILATGRSVELSLAR